MQDGPAGLHAVGRSRFGPVAIGGTFFAMDPTPAHLPAPAPAAARTANRRFWAVAVALTVLALLLVAVVTRSSTGETRSVCRQPTEGECPTADRLVVYVKVQDPNTCRLMNGTWTEIRSIPPATKDEPKPRPERAGVCVVGSE